MRRHLVASGIANQYQRIGERWAANAYLNWLPAQPSAARAIFPVNDLAPALAKPWRSHYVRKIARWHFVDSTTHSRAGGNPVCSGATCIAGSPPEFTPGVIGGGDERIGE